MSILQEMGFGPFFLQGLEGEQIDDHVFGRVSQIYGKIMRVMCEHGEFQVYLNPVETHGPVAVGDWVGFKLESQDGVNRATLLMPRRTKLIRKAAGSDRAQLIATNMDKVWIITSATKELSASRLERYVSLVNSSGAEPVVIINKVDLCPQPDTLLQELRRRLPWVPIFAVSALDERGFDQITSDLLPGKTVALVGSSGVGKTTIRNALVTGPVAATQDIRDDDHKGRHTTTTRELIKSRYGGYVIDTPGMRELGIWDAQQGLESQFSDIQVLAAKCQFRNCDHATEPGCAIQAAIISGDLQEERLKNYQKLQREQEYNQRKVSKEASANAKKNWKQISKHMRQKTKFSKKT